MFPTQGLGLMQSVGSVLNPPVISGATISASSITQGQSITLNWNVTNMISTDLSFIEFVGKGIIRKASSTDYIAYSLTIAGEDLPVMTDNIIRIVVVNDDGWGVDITLTLTVTAIPSSSAYYLKEVAVIPDEVDVIIKLLKTDSLNHRLKHIVLLENIWKEVPLNWKEIPGIYVRKIANVTLVQEQFIREDYDTGDDIIGNVWTADIAFDLVAHVKTIFNYPPIETDPDTTVRYEHAKNCLAVMESLLRTILSENRKYVDPDDSTFQWDSLEPISYGLVDGGYEGARDVWAIQVVYRFQFEQEVR